MSELTFAVGMVEEFGLLLHRFRTAVCWVMSRILNHIHYLYAGNPHAEQMQVLTTTGLIHRM